MLRTQVALCAFLIALLSGAAAAAMSTTTIVTPASTHWMPGTGPMKGTQVAVLIGDPSKPGGYVMRIKVPANVTFPPHYHSGVENVTVISGTFYVGLGDMIDKTKMTALPPGSFVSIPANVHHYAMTKGEAVIQLSGMGPFTMTSVHK